MKEPERQAGDIVRPFPGALKRERKGKVTHDGYPDDRELETIEKWDLQKKPVRELIEFTRPIWKYSDDGFFKFERGKLNLVTGGWSGNESIISALMGNRLFWGLYWYRSTRGGLYEFDIREK